MNRYTIRTGAMVAHIETPYEADAEALALLALQSQVGSGRDLGVLVAVSGGQFGPEDGDDETYCSTQALLEKLGRWSDE